jgi:3-hydroxybutyryl-CoA dehydrogenase
VTEKSNTTAPGSILLLGEERLTSEFRAAIPPGWTIFTAREQGTLGGAPALAVELTNLDPVSKRRNIERAAESLPESAPIITSAVMHTVAEQSGWTRRSSALVGLAALPTLIGKSRWELSTGPSTAPPALAAASAFCASAGRRVSVVRDQAGMVLPRILACLVNEACHAVGDAIASQEDVDTAMKLGTNYPAGPLEWGRDVGFDHIEAVLEALGKAGEPERYRPAPLLRKMALLKS